MIADVIEIAVAGPLSFARISTVSPNPDPPVVARLTASLYPAPGAETAPIELTGPELVVERISIVASSPLPP